MDSTDNAATLSQLRRPMKKAPSVMPPQKMGQTCSRREFSSVPYQLSAYIALTQADVCVLVFSPGTAGPLQLLPLH